MKVIVTIPAYNEAKSLGKVLEDIKTVMHAQKYEFEILVVNDGSKDNTVEVARSHGALVVSHPTNLGLAEAFRTELKTCLEHKADIIVHTDADGQYRSSDIPKLLKGIEDGYDLVLGSRFLGVIEEMPFMKRLGNKSFSYVISRVTGQKVTDGQTGFRAFTSRVAKNINIISNFTYTQEQIIRAIKQGFKVREVPVYFDRRDGKSRLMSSPLQYAIKAWINLFRLYRDFDPLKFFGKIGTTLMGLGFGIGLFFLYEHFTTGINGHLGLAILMLLLFVIGFQTIIFGFLADMMRK